MQEWDVVGVIAALIALFATIVAPIVKLTHAITKLTTTMENMEKNVEELTANNRCAHERLWNHEQQQDERLRRPRNTHSRDGRGPGVILPNDRKGINDMELLLEYGLQVLSALLITLIGVLGTYLTLQLSKTNYLKNVNEAQKELIRSSKITVGELQQTVVGGLKEAHADGRLTSEEIAQLRRS